MDNAVRRSPRLASKDQAKAGGGRGERGGSEGGGRKGGKLGVRKVIVKPVVKHTVSVAQFVSLGTPPVTSTAQTGKMFRLSPRQKSIADMNAATLKFGVQKIHCMVDAAQSSDATYTSNGKTAAFVATSINKAVQAQVEDMQKTLNEMQQRADEERLELRELRRKHEELQRAHEELQRANEELQRVNDKQFRKAEDEFKIVNEKLNIVGEQPLELCRKHDELQRAHEELQRANDEQFRKAEDEFKIVNEKLKIIGEQPLEFLINLADGVTLRRVVDAWVISKRGKEFRRYVTAQVNLAYEAANHSRICDGQDIIIECKTLLQRIHKAQDDKDFKAEAAQHVYLDIVKDCVDQEIKKKSFGEEGLTLSSNGFVQIFEEYVKANANVHMKLSQEEAMKISMKAKSGHYAFGEANQWLSKLAHEIFH